MADEKKETDPREIRAKGKLGEHEIDAIVINPGDWFGKTWLIEVQIGNFPYFLAVEADSCSDAIDELADSEKYGHHINVEEADLKDYDEETATRAGNDSHIVDLEWTAIHGLEGAQNGKGQPWTCKYFNPKFPADGVDPLKFEWDMIDDADYDFVERECDSCGRRLIKSEPGKLCCNCIEYCDKCGCELETSQIGLCEDCRIKPGVV